MQRTTKIQTRRGLNKKKTKQQVTRNIISHPPVIRGYEPSHKTTLRFVNPSVFNGQITFQNLLDTILIATGATSVSDLFFSVKIRRVRVWSIAVLGTTSTIELEFNGTVSTAQGNEQIFTDTSMGVEPAFVDVSPPRGTLAGMWQTSSANNAFFLRAPANSVIDVHLSLRSNPGVNVAAQNAAVALTAGAIYYRGLDGLAIATSVLQPAINPVA